jgi:hypothetical protein
VSSQRPAPGPSAQPAGRVVRTRDRYLPHLISVTSVLAVFLLIRLGDCPGGHRRLGPGSGGISLSHRPVVCPFAGLFHSVHRPVAGLPRR